MITRLGHIAIRARNIEVTAAFYRDILGLNEAFRMQNPQNDALGSVHIYAGPGQFIEIFPADDKEPPLSAAQSSNFQHLCFEVDDAAASIETLRKRGAPLDTELKKGYSGCIQFWTHDPDGNSIELMELPPDCLQTAAIQRLSPNGAFCR